MFLAVEIGNSSIGCACFRAQAQARDQARDQAQAQDQAIVTHFYIESNTHYTPQQYLRIFAKQLAIAKIDAKSITKTFIASVVQPLTDIIFQTMKILTPLSAPLIINGHSMLNITVRPENKDELGSDIILNLAEVWERNSNQASVVVDFGTAVTVSAVDESGTVCGVSIAPGITTAMKSLAVNTDQLSTVPLEFPPQIMGRDTASALQSGILYGYCGLIGTLVEGFQKELHDHAHKRTAAIHKNEHTYSKSKFSPLYVIATGGDGAVMWRRIPQIHSYARELTLCGLFRLGQINSERVR